QITPAQVAAIFGATLSAQFLGSSLNAMRFDWKSPVVTALSLSLLLRADGLLPLIVAASIAIGSKFALRLNGKHIFNPANIGIVSMILLTHSAWTTPGQWGTAMWFAIVIAGLGALVTSRAGRLDAPLVFLGTYAILVLGRAFFLGDPLSIPLLHLKSGALILFAFFMLSDPKTTPDGQRWRMAFTAGVAIIAYVLAYHFYISDGAFYALAALCLIRPLIEIFDAAPAYQWRDEPMRLELPPIGRAGVRRPIFAPAE
ncbi:MAG TPA: RnfABCDGE type electron transport complex subunit D, partial [Parvularculaceae bacterium]|nr:RnfABCDGE type electron transport complex subunit D [Parvularculaceae bacterium]